jgi:hypothetical protein
MPNRSRTEQSTPMISIYDVMIRICRRRGVRSSRFPIGRFLRLPNLSRGGKIFCAESFRRESK